MRMVAGCLHTVTNSSSLLRTIFTGRFDFSSDRLQPERTFRTETAPQSLDDHPDAGLRQIEKLGHLRTNRVRHLRRGPQRQFALNKLRDRDVGLERHVLRRRRAKNIFENKIRFVKTRFEIATAEFEMAADISAGRKILD